MAGRRADRGVDATELLNSRIISPAWSGRSTRLGGLAVAEHAFAEGRGVRRAVGQLWKPTVEFEKEHTVGRRSSCPR